VFQRLDAHHFVERQVADPAGIKPAHLYTSSRGRRQGEKFRKTARRLPRRRSA
jgi:hypothetical protein